jgi:caffeoyl-CoA O-methyltransferase
MYCDVDKDGCPDSWRAARDRIRIGGLWLCDNTIWGGYVASGPTGTVLLALRPSSGSNRLVAEDTCYVGIPIRDGVMTAVLLA